MNPGDMKIGIRYRQWLPLRLLVAHRFASFLIASRFALLTPLNFLSLCDQKLVARDRIELLRYIFQ